MNQSDLDDLSFCQHNFYKILTKDERLDSLSPNIYQLRLNQLVESLQRQGKPIRIIGLKCRQIGFSTWASSFVFHRASTRFHHNALQIADDIDNTNGIFNMVKRFYDFYPDLLKPMRRYSNEKAIVFENPDDKERKVRPGLMSNISVTTAGKMTAGRSKTIQTLHASEYAFWPNAGLVSSGLFQSVPNQPGTAIILESTANGISGKGAEFYSKWKAAESGRSGFTPIFFSWLDNQEYEIDPPEDFKMTDYEKELVKLYPKLTPRKLQFRRYKIANEMSSSLIDPETLFKVEYPLDSNEAFQSSGRPLFDYLILQKEIQRAMVIAPLISSSP